ncbi:hypothetical protein [Limnospira indica]|uniref:SPOR domain-containing protein n=1 Tax=Limnospira indica PCC 8005 TaxID=376219 RepID=A0A9P1P082_9CYAN|nr:hypothetical protein [Limnospira indica]CDM94497.1 conserved hypothetical protein [Limnospira indica PCC 8005]
MVKLRLRRWLTRISSVGVVLLTIGFSAKPSFGQASCVPPRPGEYLLLITSNTPETQALARQVLPSNIESQVCRYLNDIVTRVGGFDDVLIAEDWAAYFKETAGLSTHVVKSDAAVTPRPEPRPPVGPSGPSSDLGGQPLGMGYAVMVDYFNQPEIAARLEATMGRRIPIVSYNRRFYLLVEHTAEPNSAMEVFRRLNDQGFWSLMVDSSRVKIERPNLATGD